MWLQLLFGVCLSVQVQVRSLTVNCPLSLHVKLSHGAGGPEFKPCCVAICVGKQL